MNVIEKYRKISEVDSLKMEFLRWQCRVRQIAMRENGGRPDSSVTPVLSLNGTNERLARLVTVISKLPGYSKVAEMRHMVKSTHDPAQRREKAVEFFSGGYYQTAHEFSDTLTATFPPEIKQPEEIFSSKNCTLVFESYGQRFDLLCMVSVLSFESPYFQATWWHNLLFNSRLHPNTVVLGFQPQWAKSSAQSTI